MPSRRPARVQSQILQQGPSFTCQQIQTTGGQCAQVRIMFRKLKESFEQTNAELREELALMHLQCNDRVCFGVGHSVSRLASVLRRRTVAAGEQSTFNPVPKTEVGAFRPQAHARSVLSVVPSRPKSHPKINMAATWDCLLYTSPSPRDA